MIKQEFMESLQPDLKKLLSDRGSGSLEIASRSVIILDRCLRHNRDVGEIAEKILNVHGEMVAVEKAVNAFLKGIPVNVILDELRNAVERAGYELAQFIEGVVTTISRSKTVELGFLNAERLRKVYILESRPVCEGVHMARSLKKQGIECTVVVDSAMGHAVGKSDYVVFGADGVFLNGITNKIGTFPLALVAGHFKKPAICAFPEVKVVRKKFNDDFRLRNPEEVASGVPAENVYFEFIPSKLIQWVVTDKGRKKFSDLFRDV